MRNNKDWRARQENQQLREQLLYNPAVPEGVRASYNHAVPHGDRAQHTSYGVLGGDRAPSIQGVPEGDRASYNHVVPHGDRAQHTSHGVLGVIGLQASRVY